MAKSPFPFAQKGAKGMKKEKETGPGEGPGEKETGPGEDQPKKGKGFVPFKKGGKK